MHKYYDVLLIGGSRFIPNGSDRNEYLQKAGKVLVDLVEFWSTSDLPFSISDELNMSKIRPINVRFTAAWEPGQSDVAISKQKRSQPMRNREHEINFKTDLSHLGNRNPYHIENLH